jgi:hypothetical protein
MEYVDRMEHARPFESGLESQDALGFGIEAGNQ